MSPINMMPVEVNFKPSGKYWIASCPSLDIATQGENFDRAQENLIEALRLFFESCITRGTLEEVLKQSGYTKVEIKKVSKSAREYLAVPPPPPEDRCHA